MCKLYYISAASDASGKYHMFREEVCFAGMFDEAYFVSWQKILLSIRSDQSYGGGGSARMWIWS